MKAKLSSSNYPNFTDIVLFFGTFFIVSFLVSFVFEMINILSERDEIFTDIQTVMIYVLTFVIITIIASIYRRKRSDLFKPERVLRRYMAISPMVLLWGVISLFSINFVLEPLFSLFPESLGNMYDKMTSMGVYTLISSMLIAPFVEEILFRGIMQSDLQQRYSAPFAIILSSLIFALIHLNLLQVVSAFFISLIIGLVYYRTNSLWSVIFLHFINNTVAVLLFKLTPDKEFYITPLKEMFANDTLYYIIYGITVLISLISIYKIVTIKKNVVDDSSDDNGIVKEGSVDDVEMKDETQNNNVLQDNNYVDFNVNDKDHAI